MAFELFRYCRNGLGAHPLPDTRISSPDAQRDGEQQTTREWHGPANGRPAGLREGREHNQADHRLRPQEVSGLTPTDASIVAVLRSPLYWDADCQARQRYGL